MGKLAPRPYVDSALQLSKQKFKNLNNTEALIDILSKQQVRKVIPTASERDSKKEKSVEKTVFIGLNEVFKRLKKGELGAVILDGSSIKPSTAEHFFGLLAKTQRVCTYFVVEDLSVRARKRLKIGQITAIGIRKGHPFLELIADELDATDSTESSQPSFKTPTFTVPMGKSNKVVKLSKKHKKIT